MTKRDLTDTERKAWQAVTRHVKPLGGREGRRQVIIDPASHPFHPESTAASPSLPRISPDLPASPSKRKAAAKPQNRSNEKAVRRGKQMVSASFDLHGHTQESAWRVLPAFLRQQQAQGARCVIVITGKGRSGEGILRKNFLRWLDMPEARTLVSGYAPAHPKHGGGGAWYVYVRKRS